MTTTQFWILIGVLVLGFGGISGHISTLASRLWTVNMHLEALRRGVEGLYSSRNKEWESLQRSLDRIDAHLYDLKPPRPSGD